MALDELLDSESTSHEWLQSCVSRNIQIDLPVAHHTKIFEGVCVGELCAIKEKGRQVTCLCVCLCVFVCVCPGLEFVEAHHLRLLGAYCQGLLLGVNSQFVKDSL